VLGHATTTTQARSTGALIYQRFQPLVQQYIPGDTDAVAASGLSQPRYRELANVDWIDFGRALQYTILLDIMLVHQRRCKCLSHERRSRYTILCESSTPLTLLLFLLLESVQGQRPRHVLKSSSIELAKRIHESG
jgi:hypothetical protein